MGNKKTLVLGATTKPDRYANIAINRLVSHGHEVVAIGRDEGQVAGVAIQHDKIHFDDVDTVTLYLNPKNQQEYYDYIIETHPKRVVFNPGTENPELYKLLEENGIKSEVACTLVLLATNQY